MAKAFVLRNRIKELRNARGMSEEELGRAADVSEDAIIDFEKGKYIPSAKMAMAMCIALKCKFEDLFYAEEPVPVDQTRSMNEFKII